MRSRIVRSILLAITCGIVLAAFVESHDDNRGPLLHNEIRDDLHKLERLHSRLAQDALRTWTYLLTQHETLMEISDEVGLVALTDEIRDLSQHIKDGTQTVSSFYPLLAQILTFGDSELDRIDNDLDIAWQLYDSAMQGKFLSIDDFKRVNGVNRNSLAYFQKLMTSKIDLAKLSPAARAREQL
ncbi:MAG: hypothetical protein OEU92_17355, partial [Alphaproteobacteria bacterium]|nr:hypothetical protein [Alphaproteobacteria bacterium]